MQLAQKDVNALQAAATDPGTSIALPVSHPPTAATVLVGMPPLEREELIVWMAAQHPGALMAFLKTQLGRASTPTTQIEAHHLERILLALEEQAESRGTVLPPL